MLYVSFRIYLVSIFCISPGHMDSGSLFSPSSWYGFSSMYTIGGRNVLRECPSGAGQIAKLWAIWAWVNPVPCSSSRSKVSGRAIISLTGLLVTDCFLKCSPFIITELNNVSLRSCHSRHRHFYLI